MSDVLLLEDDVLIAELVKDALLERGLAVDTLYSARAAVVRIEAEPRSFSVLVTDINLGEDLTGFDVARRARALNPDVRVVYVTGLPTNIYEADEEALMFPKPFNPSDLAAQVGMLLDKP